MTPTLPRDPAQKLPGDPVLAQAYQALRAGNQAEARRLALTAALNFPDTVETR